jgi:hypothetical protein
MRAIISLALLFAASVQLGCTSMPSRFNASDAIETIRQ